MQARAYSIYVLTSDTRFETLVEGESYISQESFHNARCSATTHPLLKSMAYKITFDDEHSALILHNEFNNDEKINVTHYSVEYVELNYNNFSNKALAWQPLFRNDHSQHDQEKKQPVYRHEKSEVTTKANEEDGFDPLPWEQLFPEGNQAIDEFKNLSVRVKAAIDFIGKEENDIQAIGRAFKALEILRERMVEMISLNKGVPHFAAKVDAIMKNSGSSIYDIIFSNKEHALKLLTLPSVVSCLSSAELIHIHIKFGKDLEYQKALLGPKPTLHKSASLHYIWNKVTLGLDVNSRPQVEELFRNNSILGEIYNIEKENRKHKNVKFTADTKIQDGGKKPVRVRLNK